MELSTDTFKNITKPNQGESMTMALSGPRQLGRREILRLEERTRAQSWKTNSPDGRTDEAHGRCLLPKDMAVDFPASSNLTVLNFMLLMENRSPSSGNIFYQIYRV
jgi:hypothetical protein